MDINNNTTTPVISCISIPSHWCGLTHHSITLSVMIIEYTKSILATSGGYWIGKRSEGIHVVLDKSTLPFRTSTFMSPPQETS